MKAFLNVVILCATVGFAWTACQNFTDLKVKLNSKNFEYILKWDEEKRLPPDTLYNVQYKQYGDKQWTDKYECQNISKTFCNLTSEITNDTKHFEYKQVYARVKALPTDCSSDWDMSERISVRDYTTIGTPSLTYVPGVNSIKFQVHPPNIFLKDEDGHPQTIQDIFYDLTIEYHLNISNRKSKKTLPLKQKNAEFEVAGLDPATDYNGTVYMYFGPGKTSESGTFLVRTLTDKTWMKLILGGLLVSLLLLTVVVFYVSHKYVQQHRNLPKSLDLRGVPPYKPMNTTKDHILISHIHGFSKPGHFNSIWAAPNMWSNPSDALKNPPLLFPQGNTYKSQVTESTFQSSIQSSDQTNLSPVSYLSQETHPSLPDSSSKNSSLTYGVIVEETDSIWNNTYQSNRMMPCHSPENNTLQYRPQTERLPNSPSENNFTVTAKLLDSMSDPDRKTQDVEFQLKNDPLIQQLVLTPEKTNWRFDMSSLFPLLKEENTQASDVDLGNYKPQTTISLSLLSSVTVNNNLHSDHESDRGQFLLHGITEGDVPTGHLFAGPVDTLTQEKPLPFQYRANNIQRQGEE